MINFANVDIPSYVKVNKINYSILPKIESKTQRVAGRPGVYDFGIEVGQREIEVEISIIADNEFDVVRKARTFAEWLFHTELQPLIISDEPDKQYLARVVDETVIDEIFKVGQGTIKFLCPDAYAESIVEKAVTITPNTTDPFQVNNFGTVETHPVINLTLNKNTTSIAVISEDKYVQIGANETVEKTTKEVNPLVFHDDMTSYTGWTTASAVDGGVITGAFTSNGSYLYASDYGSGTSWHGPASMKAIGSEVQDFSVDCLVEHSATSFNQIGRIDIYLLDINGVQIGKMSLVDSTAYGDHARFEAMAGDWQNTAYYFANDYGYKKGAFARFNGMIRIYRTGNRWGAYIGHIDSTGRHHTRLIREWYDTKKQFTKKLARVQIHVASNSSFAPVNAVRIKDIKVYDRSITVDPKTETPIIFKSGDVITIDNRKAIVLRNGQPIFTSLDPGSDFFSLAKGANGIVVSPPVATVEVRYKERWL